MDDKVIARMSAEEIRADSEEQALIQEFVDADCCDEEMEIVVMAIELGLKREQIRSLMLRCNEEIERGVWS